MALSKANFPLGLDHRLYRSDEDHVVKGDDFFGVCIRYLTLTFVLGSHHLHIKSTFIIRIHLTRMAANLLSVL